MRLLSGAIAVAVLASAAGAQPTPADSLRLFTLDTLALAALRTPVPPLRAPVALTVLSGAELNRARPGLALDQVLLAVPGVQVDNRFNPALGERVSVRGFGARAQFGVRGVRVLVDGVPATFPDGQSALNHVDPAALARVEVVRGPAAALYGNASGGVIRLESTVSEGPDALAATLSGGPDGTWRGSVTAGGARGSTWYRAGVTRLSSDGYRRHAQNESWLARGVMGVRGRRDDLRLAWSWVDYDAQNPGSLSDSLLRVDRRQAFARNAAQATGEEGHQRQVGFTWRREGSLGWEAAAYGTLRDIDNPIPAAIVVLDRRVLGFRGTIFRAWSLAAGRLRWAAGGEAESQRDDRQNYVNESGARGGRVLDQLERVSNQAAFTQLGVSWPGAAQLLAALRFDHFGFRADDRLPVTGEDPDDSGTRSFDAWSPTIGGAVSLGGGAWVYANLSTAFETPTTTELTNRPDGAGGFNPGLRPQRTTSGEGGVKLRLRGNGQLELALFHARVRDQLVPFEVESAPGRVFLRNAGLSRHRGVEASAAVEPVRGVRARAAYSHLDARFVDYQVGEVEVGGNRVPGIAPHRLTASLFAGGERGAFGGVELRAVSATPVADTDSDGDFESPGYTLVDLRAGYGLRAGSLRVRPWMAITNLLGEEYNASVVVNAFGRRYYEPGPGRGVYLGMDIATGGSEL